MSVHHPAGQEPAHQSAASAPRRLVIRARRVAARGALTLACLGAALPGFAQPAGPAAARDNSDVALAGHALAAARADILAADHAPAPVLSAKAASIDLQMTSQAAVPTRAWMPRSATISTSRSANSR